MNFQALKGPEGVDSQRRYSFMMLFEPSVAQPGSGGSRNWRRLGVRSNIPTRLEDSMAEDNVDDRCRTEERPVLGPNQ